MKPPPSRIRKLLNARQLPTVFKINLSDPRVIEIAALSGVDAVWLCTEHVPNDWIGLESQIRAARVHGIDTLVRVGRGSYSDYIRPLEAGATGIIVPHVESDDEARQIVEWVRFHPLGKRALDGGNVDGLFCLLPVTEYIQHSNQERLLILQIESPESLDKVEKIAAVPGFDGLLFGPGDFSHRIGEPGQINHPEAVIARKRVAQAARANGKLAMTAGLIAPLPELVDEGYNLIGIGADVVFVGNAVRQRLEHVRGLLEAMPSAVKTTSSTPYA
jgi:4-hydroxy-2-oxoheptanedioate aldolase